MRSGHSVRGQLLSCPSGQTDKIPPSLEGDCPCPCPGNGKKKKRGMEMLKCERCGKPGADIAGEFVLCQGNEGCLSLVLREWRVKHEEFGELGEATRPSPCRTGLYEQEQRQGGRI